MRFALIDNKRVLAAPTLRALCPGCFQPVTAKCGSKRIWHWAHRSEMICDRWWESETQWHRDWKSKFPHDWQEIIHHDAQSGEKHIADVKTNHGLVIEFQHSRLKLEERAAREQFYKNMFWIVDGTRLKRDYQRFLKGGKLFVSIAKGIFFINSPEECFPRDWLGSSAPVFIDFQGTEGQVQPEPARNLLWCLLPGQVSGKYVVLALARDNVVNEAINNPALVEDLLRGQKIAETALAAAQQARLPTISLPQARAGWARRRRWRL